MKAATSRDAFLLDVRLLLSDFGGWRKRALSRDAISKAAFAVTSVTLATILGAALVETTDATTFMFYIAAIVVTGLYAGPKAALSALVLSIPMGWYFVVPPLHGFDVPANQDLIRMAVYVGVSLPIIVLAHMRRRSEARLEEIEGQLALAQARLDGLSEGDRPVEHGRRPRLDQQGVVACAGGLEVDLDKRTAVRNGGQIRLTHTEWRILSHLAANVGAVVTSGELEQSAFGDDRSDRAQHLRNCMLRLRRKVESDPSNPQSIITAHGIGYRLATAA